MYTGEGEDVVSQHRKVERSNSTITSLSVDSAFSHSTPVSSSNSTPVTPLSPLPPFYSSPAASSSCSTILHSTPLSSNSTTCCSPAISPLARRDGRFEAQNSTPVSEKCPTKTLLTTEVSFLSFL